MPRMDGVAYSPCHITGFFSIHDEGIDVSKVGSTGAGVALAQGVVTQVTVQTSSRPRIVVTFNGRPLHRPVVSESVVREYQEIGGFRGNVKVSHKSILPIGAGYGTSGAGALGLSLALGHALGTVSTLEASRIAHEAEVKCRTGLGTVTAVFHGGFLARLRPGAPGFARVRKLPVSKNERVVSASLRSISTAKVLSHRTIRPRVNLCGRGLVAKLLRRPKTNTFLTLSRQFTECVGLATPRLHSIVRVFDAEELVSAQMMIGEGIFSITHKDRVSGLSKLLRTLGVVPVVSRIAPRGAHLV